MATFVAWASHHGLAVDPLCSAPRLEVVLRPVGGESPLDWPSGRRFRARRLGSHVRCQAVGDESDNGCFPDGVRRVGREGTPVPERSVGALSAVSPGGAALLYVTLLLPGLLMAVTLSART